MGRTIVIEYRFGDGSTTEVSRLADELVKSNVDVLVAGGGQATRAARNATSTIPIVMVSATDPGVPGTIASLARPSGMDVDVVIAADLMAFTRVWLGYAGLMSAVEAEQISLHGSARGITTVRRLLALPDEPKVKSFRFAAFPRTATVAA